jgi:hypothetical protein
MDRGEQLIYLAGFFDGEGCISICHHSNSKKYKYLNLDIFVSNTNIPSLELFKNVFNGNIYAQSNKTYKDHPNWKQAYVWQLGNNRASECLKELLPYLEQKKPQALLAIEFQKSINETKRRKLTNEDMLLREELWLTLRKMKKL